MSPTEHAHHRRGERVRDPRRQVPHRDAELQHRDQAEHVTRHDVHRGPHRHVRLRAALHQVDRLLARGVAEPDDEHRPARPGVAVAVVAGVHDRAAVLGPSPASSAGPGGGTRRSRRPRGRLPLVVVGRGDPAAVRRLESGDPLAEPRLDAVVRAVVLQVLDDLVACRVARPARAACSARAAPTTTSACAGAAGRSADATAGPTASSASSTSNAVPAWRRHAAVASPAADAPTTSTSVVRVTGEP